LNKQLIASGFKSFSIYYFLRFIALSLGIFYTVQMISPFYSTAFFLSLLLPSAVSLPAFAAMATAVLLIFYLGTYYLMSGHTRSERIAFSVSSGANNIGLGVTLTILFFPGDINVFIIVSQLAWIIVLIPVRYFYRWQDK
jgi:hypothetical protein